MTTPVDREPAALETVSGRPAPGSSSTAARGDTLGLRLALAFLGVAFSAIALLALVAGLTVTRRISRPIARLIAVTRSMAGGDRAARAGDIQTPGELRELAAAFDQMADAVGQEDRIRRDLVADLAHELRTPVAVLQAGHEALLDGWCSPTLRNSPRCGMRSCACTHGR